jgi:hypothetical protein
MVAGHVRAVRRASSVARDARGHKRKAVGYLEMRRVRVSTITSDPEGAMLLTLLSVESFQSWMMATQACRCCPHTHSNGMVAALRGGLTNKSSYYIQSYADSFAEHF